MSSSAARNYCQSLGGYLAKVKDVVEIQDILPDSILHSRLMQQLLLFYRFRFVNDTRLYWVDRTDEDPHENSVSERLLKSCSIKPEIIDRNCISIQYRQQNPQDTQSTHERCITESNDCSSKSAMPLCVDVHLEKNITVVPPIADDQTAKAFINVSLDYSCGDGEQNLDYHLIDDYCYRIFFHEISWEDARDECRRDGAILFVAEKSVTLQHIKALFLRRRSYVSSGLAHVGVYYNPSNRTVSQYSVNNRDEIGRAHV